MANDDLKKGWKEALLGVGLATAPVTSAAQSHPAQHRVEDKPQFDLSTMHNELKPIANLETNNGQNMSHAPHSKGDYHTAFGPLGMKIITAHDEYLKSKNLQKLHPNLQEASEFTKEFKSNPQFYNNVAAHHWNKLKKLTGSIPRAVYGWRWGQGNAVKAPEEKVNKDPYVNKYTELSHTNTLKSELSKNIKIKQAAFRSSDGKVIGTGSFHNIEELPEDFDFEKSERGFLTEDNVFVTREEATNSLQIDHLVQSEELDLSKVQPTPVFPKLGLPDDRRETPLVSTKQQFSNKQKLLTNANPKVTVPDKIVGMASPNPKMSVSFATSNSLRPNTVRGQHQNSPIATQLHENLHLMFNRVGKKFGNKARVNLAQNLFNSIPDEAKDSLHHYVQSRYGKGKIAPSLWHEEHLSGLLNYLNNPSERDVYHQDASHTDEQRLKHNVQMKQAYKAIRNAASQADESWTKRLIRKNEQEVLHKAQKWTPTAGEIEFAAEMAEAMKEQLPEFKAAKFLAGHFTPSEDDIAEALREHEGDYPAAALMAYKIPVTEDNIRNLKHIMSIQTLDKSEMDIAAIPRKVQPFDEVAIPVAKMIQEAFIAGNVHPVSLNGKHSKGTALVKDWNHNTLWLLKPGSGDLSRAAGIREETASQSRREVAFNIIARLMGLGEYVPKSALLVMDGNEVAALEFFSTNYKALDKIKREKQVDLPTVFEKYNLNGTLYKWAVMDYLLGQVDRHAGNMMMDDKYNIKMIDAGSTFAGDSFAPGNDPKSFVPFYLRVFSGRKFNVLTPLERYNILPKLPHTLEIAIKSWIDSINEGQIIRILHQYQINPQPFLNRLYKLRAYPGNKSEFLAKFYSNLNQ